MKQLLLLVIMVSPIWTMLAMEKTNVSQSMKQKISIIAQNYSYNTVHLHRLKNALANKDPWSNWRYLCHHEYKNLVPFELIELIDTNISCDPKTIITTLIATLPQQIEKKEFSLRLIVPWLSQKINKLALKYKNLDSKKLQLFTTDKQQDEEFYASLFRAKKSLPRAIQNLMEISEILMCIRGTDENAFKKFIKFEEEIKYNKTSSEFKKLEQLIETLQTQLRKSMSEEQWLKQCWEWHYEGQKQVAKALLNDL